MQFGGARPGKAVSLWPFAHRQRCSSCPAKVCKRILIMMSNTGGGHKASAEAIRAAFQEKHGDAYEVSGAHAAGCSLFQDALVMPPQQRITRNKSPVAPPRCLISP